MNDGASGFDRTMRARVVRGSAWVGVGFGGGQVISFLATLVLARLLDPESFGIVAAGMVVLAIVTQIQDSGLGAALIHGRDRDPATAAATVLVYASVAGVALFGLIFVLAPVYTKLIGIPEATGVLRGLAVVLLFRGLSTAPASILERELDFRSQTAAELTGFIFQAVVAIGCAIAGLGPWSLVAGQVAGAGARSVVLWIRVPFMPSPREASLPMLREMLGYGRFVTGANLVNVASTTLDTVVVGRFLGASALGAYAVAWRLAGLPSTVIGIVVGRVMFSMYARLQQDLPAVRMAYVENLQRTLLLALPAAATLGIAAEPLVMGLLGKQWSEAIRPLQIFSVYTLQRLLAGPSGELFKGIGRPSLAFASSLLYLGLVTPALLALTPTLGLNGAALAVLIAGLITGTVVMIITFRVIDLSWVHLARSLVRPSVPGAAVACSLLVVTPIAVDLRPLAGLAVVLAVAALSFVAGTALVARPVVMPIISAFRRERSDLPPGGDEMESRV